MNIYSFTGRLARDCETRFTQSGMAICSFSVAVDFGYGDNKGTNWIRCSLFGKRAEGQLPQYLLKGTQVAISGELKIGEYDAKDGTKKTSIDVSVDKLDLIGGRNDSTDGGQPNQGNQENQGFPTHGGQPNQGNQQPVNPQDPFADDGQQSVDDDIPF